MKTDTSTSEDDLVRQLADLVRSRVLADPRSRAILEQAAQEMVFTRRKGDETTSKEPYPVLVQAEGEPGSFRTYIVTAPDLTSFGPGVITDVGVEFFITLKAANGEVVYEATGMGESGELVCRKVEDRLTPYVAKENRT